MATKTYSELTRNLIDQALDGLSEVRQTRFHEAWNQMKREILEEARRTVAESFANQIETRTVGTLPGEGAAALGLWDDLRGMWEITRDYPGFELDHQRIARTLDELQGPNVGQEYRRRVAAFEKEWKSRHVRLVKG